MGDDIRAQLCNELERLEQAIYSTAALAEQRGWLERIDESVETRIFDVLDRAEEHELKVPHEVGRSLTNQQAVQVIQLTKSDLACPSGRFSSHDQDFDWRGGLNQA